MMENQNLAHIYIYIYMEICIGMHYNKLLVFLKKYQLMLAVRVLYYRLGKHVKMQLKAMF